MIWVSWRRPDAPVAGLVAAFSTLIIGIAWPAAVVLLGLLFRHEIKQKFGDIEQAGPSGVTFRQQASRQVTVIPGDLKTLPAAETAFQQMVQDAIIRDLDKMKDDTKISALVAALTKARIERGFEVTFAYIFGSQIGALQQLKQAGGRAPLANAELYFEQIKAQYPEFYAGATFANWAEYLEKNLLARIDGNDVVLTDAGDDFLSFVAQAKPGVPRSF